MVYLVYALLVLGVLNIVILSYILFDFWVATVITIAVVLALVLVLVLLYLIAKRKLGELYGRYSF